MADQKTVVKELARCIKHDRECEKCFYHNETFCRDVLMDDALELLKGQNKMHEETRIGHWISVEDGNDVAIDNDGFPVRSCFCSECKTWLVASDEYPVYGKYCPFCGAKMEISKATNVMSLKKNLNKKER